MNKLTITRKKNLIQFDRLRIVLDNKTIYRIKAGESKEFEVSEGSHILKITDSCNIVESKHNLNVVNGRDVNEIEISYPTPNGFFYAIFFLCIISILGLLFNLIGIKIYTLVLATIVISFFGSQFYFLLVKRKNYFIIDEL
ncbi:MAG: hypothetical protein LBJ72_04055 [Dysgonamonadaceae bacterium]|jgi:hypothetical protein|nr:hypothetical protein [Dysgonamonadaceae bacterium]